ncbi:hypothetical protein JCM11491_004723 [Sporobolomyces phaffii]
MTVDPGKLNEKMRLSRLAHSHRSTSMDTPLRSRASSGSLSGTPTPAPRNRGSGLGRVPGTPLGRVLAAEGYTVRSPRKIRQRSLPDKARDWISNRVLAVETSIQLWSFDAAGYPLAIGLNAAHLVVRLPELSAALPPVSSLWSAAASDAAKAVSSSSRYARQVAQLDADARLAALQGAGHALGHHRSFFRSGWIGWTLSVVLVLVSVANAVYLATRTRKYQLMLRKDPLSSPNAKAAALRFAPPSAAGQNQTLLSRVRDYVWPSSHHGRSASEPEPHSFPIQELHVWTPEYVLWSVRLFTGYPPPVALMYHFLSPATFVPFVVVGPAVVAVVGGVVSLYGGVVRDRQILATETMHEYNATFVYPRVSVAKRDAATSTDELEFGEWKRQRDRRRDTGGSASEQAGVEPSPARRRR